MKKGKMKVRDLLECTFDKANIYKEEKSSEDKIDFCDLYEGAFNEMPGNILEMDIRIISAKKKGVLDIEVY